MLTSQNLNWIAGIVEGEGCFRWARSPNICVVMTDKDVMERLANYWQTPLYVYDRSHENNRKTQYKLNIFGSKAIGWMFTLYSLMGARRRAKIEEILTIWKSRPGRAGWQKEYWQNRKEQADAKAKSGGVAGVAKK